MAQDSTYVLNVVVSSKHRGQGIGSILMAAAAGMAKEEWSCSAICAHVSAQNDVRPSYLACGCSTCYCLIICLAHLPRLNFLVC